MSEVILFAGTTEGRDLAEFLSRQRVKTQVCVATWYGERLLLPDEYCTVHTGRMDAEQMCGLIRRTQERDTVYVVDATHPYATEVTENIREACRICGAEYLRLLRASCKVTGETDAGAKADPAKERDAAGRMEGLVEVDSVEAAVHFLKGTEGNILAATGSKELYRFTELPDYQNRVYARVLPSPEVAAACVQLGFFGAHLICMQGPFDEELNTAMLKQTGAKWLVTKESGKTGGFEEKLAAAKKAGAGVVLIGRPRREEGLSPEEVRAYLIGRLHLKVRRRILLVGVGMGSADGMTLEAKKACRGAQLLIGAARMLEMFADTPAAKFASYRPEEIRAYVDAHPQYETVALLQSGDVGFYSGAKRLLEAFSDEEVTVFPGISSLVYLCAKRGTSWEDAKLLSLHGRSANLISAVREHAKVFALLGKGEEISQICEKLVYYGFSDARVTVGENLSYPQERIRSGTARQMAEESFCDLCALLIERPKSAKIVTHGLEDDDFLRGDVPMTKSEVRSVSLSKLRLCRDSVVYDIGAGTGSVSVEAAIQAAEGQVFAVEKKAEAAELIRANRRKFAADHLTVIEGTAPEALAPLPAPTHAFIGGSSGNLREILEALLRKNPQVRVVINCIALETVAEALECMRALAFQDVDIVSITAARAKEAGRYHMMMGQNPVYIISAEGCVV